MYVIGLNNRTPSKRRLVLYREQHRRNRETRRVERYLAQRIPGGTLSAGRDQQNIAQNEFEELGARDDGGRDVRHRRVTIRKLCDEHQGGVSNRQDEKREHLALSRR